MKTRTVFYILTAMYLTIGAILLITQCHGGQIAGAREAREDAKAFRMASKARLGFEARVTAIAETDTMPRNSGDDAADDPAIWVHPEQPERSLIWGTDKKGGLAAYDLTGKQLTYIASGLPNNIDVSYSFPIGKDTIDLLGVSDRQVPGIVIRAIDRSTGEARELEGGRLEIPAEQMDEVYGFCMYHELATHRHYAFVNSKDGNIFQYLISAKPGADGIILDLVRKLKVPSQPEGMVADGELATLFVGEEGAGIWRFSARQEEGTEGSLIPMTGMDNPEIRYDVEGLALYLGSQGKGYLLASSQGNFSYALFTRESPYTYLGSFVIMDTQLIDGVEETDGLDLINLPLGPDFPSGLLVVQDGYNYDGNRPRPQNFKYIPWERVNAALKLPLGMDTTYSAWMGR
ncbi:MAG TPA: phytase [Bacteroidales bacterium]|nr:phytase [Bacteroidales bacterium]